MNVKIKNSIVLLGMLLLPAMPAVCGDREERIKVYSVDSVGVKSIFPSQEIVKNGSTVKVYDYDSAGIKEPYPSEIIESGELAHQKRHYNDIFYKNKILEAVED